jgi:hypothetical protein
MEDHEIALTYQPHILFDLAEPFEVKRIGYTVFRRTQKSDSFKRIVPADPEKYAFAIEYAVYFDYDIQHLYDLEHIWVFVGHSGKVADAEASFHGKYLKGMSLGQNVEDGMHVRFFCQPGKHAFLPAGRLFTLLPDWNEVCNAEAGSMGLLVMDLFEDTLSTTPELQKTVCRYIREHFSFQPTLQFEPKGLEDSLFCPWPQLKAEIPARIKKELARITEKKAAF